MIESETCVVFKMLFTKAENLCDGIVRDGLGNAASQQLVCTSKAVEKGSLTRFANIADFESAHRLSGPLGHC